MIWNWFWPEKKKDPRVVEVCAALVEAAGNGWFHDAAGVPDTWEGRFELLVLHVALFLERWTSMPPALQGSVAQGVVDGVFTHLDGCLREMGVGDLSMGKKMRRMGRLYIARMAAYRGIFSSSDLEERMCALFETIFVSFPLCDGEKGVKPSLIKTSMGACRHRFVDHRGLARYVTKQYAHLMTTPDDHLLSVPLFLLPVSGEERFEAPSYD